jgi:hypothetical protein
MKLLNKFLFFVTLICTVVFLQCQSPVVQDPAPAVPKTTIRSGEREIAEGVLPVSGYELRYQELFSKNGFLNPNDWFYRTDTRFGGINDAKQVVIKDGIMF